MEFPGIGHQCGVSLCKQLDFLPIKCDYCLKIFCQEHNLPHNHSCQDFKISTEYEAQGKLIEYRYSCTLKGCKKWELTPIQCSFCEQIFCLSHKHQIDHSCIKYSPPSNPLAAAAAKIEELTSQLSSQPKAKKTKKNDKLAAKVQLMKMKANAVGSKNIPLEDRIFFLVSLPKCLASKEALPLFVSLHWTVGRAVDAIASLAKVTNRNNECVSSRLCLFRANDGCLLGSFDSVLKVLLDHEEIFNGQSIILEYCLKDTVILENFDTYRGTNS